MAERRRVLAVGGGLLGLVVVGLVVGLLLLNRHETPPPAHVSPSPSATDVRAQVEQAYLHYWEAYADALLRLDPSRLGEVLAGDALEHQRQQVEEQRANNQPVRIRVEHDYVITLVDQATASVEDNYVSHSVRLDPQTMQPIEEDPNRQVRRSYTMKKVGGVWKATLVIGFGSSSP